MKNFRHAIASLSIGSAILAAGQAHAQAPAGAEPPAPAAAPATPPAAIDAKALAIYERGVQAARACRTLELTSQTKMDGMEEMAGMLPEGFGAKHRVLFRAQAEKEAGAVSEIGGAVRIEQLDDAGVVNFIVIDEAADNTGLFVDPRAKTYAAVTGDEWAMVAGMKLIALPNWFFEQRLRARPDAAEMLGDARIVRAALDGVVTLDGVECDVLKVVREMKMSPDDGMEAGEGMEDLAAVPTLRIKETIAFARTDGLPRSITMMPEMDDFPDMGEFPVPITLLSGVKVDPELEGALLSTAAPEGFAKVDPPKTDFMLDDEDADAAEAPALKVKVGDMAPDFALKDLAGAEVTLASLKGKVVLLDFWATWCGPCKAVMPAIQKISDDYKDKGVVVLGINTWERSSEAARKYMEEKKFTYGCLLSGDSLAEAYGVPGIPTLVVIGKDGRVALLEVGMGGDAPLRAAIDAELAK